MADVSAPATPDMSDLAIGIDIGGTKIAAGLVDIHGHILQRTQIQTPGHEPELVEQAIESVVNELDQGHQHLPVGIGAAGWMDLETGTVLFSPHLAWRDEPLRDRLQARMDRRVEINNDANAAAWAEWRFGAAQGESHLVCLTLGTGIGGAMVVDGVVQRGRYGVAGEFGHMTMVPGGHQCECGNRGCWEQYASGNALGRDARDLLNSGSPMAREILAATGGDARQITGMLVTTLALEGVRACRDLIGDIGEWLGLGMANVAAALDPGTFVIGGGLSAAGDLLLEPAIRTYERKLTGRGYRPLANIRLAALGPSAGLIGAADLARQAQNLAPSS